GCRLTRQSRRPLVQSAYQERSKVKRWGLGHPLRHDFGRVSDTASSSGGLMWRNENSSARSEAIFSTPQMTSGSARKLHEMSQPEMVGLIAEARLRGTAVTLAAAVRSAGVTTAITNEVRVGTSIWARADLTSNRIRTTVKL